MNTTEILKLADAAGVEFERNGEALVLAGWSPLPMTDMMIRDGAPYCRAYDIPEESRSDREIPEMFVCAVEEDSDDDAILLRKGHWFYPVFSRLETYLRRIIEARQVEARRKARIVMLDKSFVDALFELNHRGPKNQAYTINQTDSLKGNFSAHFPIGHTPSVGQCYFVNIRKDIRMTLKSSESSHTSLTTQALIAKAIRDRDDVFAKYIAEGQREAYLMLIDCDMPSDAAAIMNKAAEFNLCRPLHQVQRNMVRRKVLPPFSQDKDVLRFIPIECETPPTWRVWYFAEPGRACFSRPGATQATPEIPEDVISIQFRSESATGSHWTDHWICIGEPVPIKVSIDKTSNAGNASHDERCVEI